MPTESGTEGKWLQLAGKKNQKVHASSKRTDTSQPKPRTATQSVAQEQREQPRTDRYLGQFGGYTSRAHLEKHRTEPDSPAAFLLI